jgi:pyrimidine-nucleoside phosphorylase
VLAVQLIRKKRDGVALDDGEIRAFIAGVTDGTLPDYQVAAMLMAVFFRGLSDRELATWADAMTASGDVIDLGHIRRAKVDKHSTGGVGDKISIPLAPAVAACGVAVPMVSGRGLGHTGGTLDKLESIPGFRVDLPVDRFAELVDTLGTCLIGQTARIAPADKRLYALRDVTATVESLPMIAASIMSKKLAEGIDGLVVDCKVGRGAFMKTVENARSLCGLMRTIGERAGKRVTCVLTDMEAPIGRTIGNALEIRESIEVLRGGGPADTRELVHVLGGEMLALAGVARDPADGAERIKRALADGSALEVFRKVVAAQGGDPRVCDSPGSVLPRAQHRDELALAPGRVVAIDSEALGIAAVLLGAGRRTKEDVIVPAAGLVVDAYLGELIEPGAAPQITLHHDLAAGDPRLAEARAMITGAFAIEADTKGPALPDLAAPPNGGAELESSKPVPAPRASRVLEVIR